MAEAKASGARFGRQRQTPDTVVRRIVLERDSGRTYADIARDLSTTGVRTPEGKAVWQPSTVRRVYNAAQREVA